MNHIVINELPDLKEVIDASIYLFPGTRSQVQEEIYHNYWLITFSNDLIQKITLEDLKKFVAQLLQKRTQQLLEREDLTPATFYIWHDWQAGQLRFNLLSGYDTALPFGCKLNMRDSVEPILEDFYTKTLKSAVEGDVIEYLEPGEDWDDDDEEEEPFVLDVYATVLPLDYCPELN